MMDIVTNAIDIMMSGSDSKSKNFAEVVSNGEVVFTAAVDGEYNVKFLNIKPGIFNGSTYCEYYYRYTDEGAEGLEPHLERTFTILYAALCREDKILIMSRLTPSLEYQRERFFWYYTPGETPARGCWNLGTVYDYEHKFEEGGAGAVYRPNYGFRNYGDIWFRCSYPIDCTYTEHNYVDGKYTETFRETRPADPYTYESSFSIGEISSGMLSPLSPAEINTEYEKMYKHFHNLNS